MRIKLSKSQWERMGKDAGWICCAADVGERDITCRDRAIRCKNCGTVEDISTLQVEGQPRKYAIGKKGYGWCDHCHAETNWEIIPK